MEIQETELSDNPENCHPEFLHRSLFPVKSYEKRNPLKIWGRAKSPARRKSGSKRLIGPSPLRAKGCHSDGRHRFSEAVVNGRGSKWPCRVGSGSSSKVCFETDNNQPPDGRNAPGADGQAGNRVGDVCKSPFRLLLTNNAIGALARWCSELDIKRRRLTVLS